MKKILLILYLSCTLSILKSQSITNNLKIDSSKIEILNKYLNIKYIYGGNNINRGIDCSYLTKLLYKDLFNLEIPRTSFLQFKYFKNSNKSLDFGRLLFFKMKKKMVDHVGMYLGNNYFIHASSKYKKVIICELNSNYLSKLIL